ncbi:MAG: MFS transporter [Gammaproteobacteria bacterium]
MSLQKQNLMRDEPKNSLSLSIHQLLVNEENARSCREIPDEACKESPRNFLLLLVSYFMTKLGDAIANPKTVLAWIIVSVHAPVWMIGLLVPIRESGSLIPQLVIANFIRRQPIRKWVWVAGSLIQAAAIAAIGGVAFFLEGAQAGYAIIIALTVFSLARGLCSIAAKDVLGKTIPKGQRGQLNGWSASAAGFITIGLGFTLLVAGPAGNSELIYGFGLIAAAALWVIAAAFYSRITEFAGETSGGRNGLVEAFSRLSILIEDKPFRLFVLTRSLLLCSALIAPFLIALSQQHLGIENRLLGMFIIASGFASLISAPVWGRFTDRSSRTVMTAASALTACIGFAVVGISVLYPTALGSVWFLPGIYCLLMVAHAGVRVGRKTYIVDLGSGNQRTDYVAVSNSVIGVVLLAMGLLSALASLVSIVTVVAVLSAMGAIGAVLASRLPETT